MSSNLNEKIDTASAVLAGVGEIGFAGTLIGFSLANLIKVTESGVLHQLIARPELLLQEPWASIVIFTTIGVKSAEFGIQTVKDSIRKRQ